MFDRFLQEFIRHNPNETFDPETWDHQAFQRWIGRNGALTEIAQELKKVSKERADKRIMDIEQSMSDATRKMLKANTPNGRIVNQRFELLNPQLHPKPMEEIHFHGSTDTPTQPRLTTVPQDTRLPSFQTPARV